MCVLELASLSRRVEVFTRCPGALEVELVSNTMQTQTQPMVRKAVSSDRAVRAGFGQEKSRSREEITGEQKLKRRAVIGGS